MIDKGTRSLRSVGIGDLDQLDLGKSPWNLPFLMASSRRYMTIATVLLASKPRIENRTIRGRQYGHEQKREKERMNRSHETD